MLTITREAFPQIGKPSVSPVFLDQSRETDPPAALAAMAGDFEHRQLALQFAKRD